MQVHLITVEFIFRGCRSLKEKRSRLRGIRDRLGRLPAVAIAESGYQNAHDRSRWSIVVLAQNNSLFNRMWSDLEDELLQIDGEMIERKIEQI